MLESFYWAVRTDSLYTTDYVSSLKGQMTAQQRNIGEFSPLFHYKTGYEQVPFNSDAKRNRGAKDEKGILRKNYIVIKRLSYDWPTRQNSQVTEYLTNSHVKNCDNFSSTGLFGKHFVVECTW